MRLVLGFEMALAAAVLACVLAWSIGRTKRALRARRVRTRMGAAVPEAAVDGRGDGTVTVEGTLHLDGAPRLTTFFPYGVSLMEEATPYAKSLGAPARAQVGGIVLDGPVQVVLGSVETSLVAAASDARALGIAALPDDGMLRSVANGDRVVVRGRLERIAGETASDYRSESVRHRLVAEGEGALAIATTGLPRPAGHARAIAGYATLASLVGAGVVVATAQLVPPAGVAPLPADVPAARRGRPGCADLVDANLRIGDPWAARERLASCDWPPAAALVALHLSELQVASDTFDAARAAGIDVDPTVTEIETHLAAGRNARARDVVALLRDRHFAGAAPETTRAFACIEGAVARRAGHPDGTEMILRAAAGKAQPYACGLLVDDFALTPHHPAGPEARHFLLERFPDDLFRLVNDVEDLNRHVGLFGVTSVVVADPGSRLPAAMPLVASALAHAEQRYARERDAGTAWGSAYAERFDYQLYTARLAVDVALFHAYMGEREDARTALAPVDRLAELATDDAVQARVGRFHERQVGEAHEYPRAELARLLLGYGAAVAMHAGDRDRMERYLAVSDHGAAEDAIRRYLADTGNGQPPRRRLDHWNAKFLDAAATGDGQRAADVLRAEMSTGRNVLARMVPKITEHHYSLVKWARNGMPPADLRAGLLPLARNVADRRDAARLLGERDLEARWAPIARTLRDALLRRDGAPVWMALEKTAMP